MPNWEEIRKEYEAGGITLKNLAEKHGVKLGTLKSRKSRDGWNATKRKKDATKKDAGTIETKRKRSGNPNPQNQFSHRNNPKLKHGLLSKYLHEEQIEIMDVVAEMDFLEQLWFQIQVKFSAIVRMQKIMWVRDADDMLKEESGSSWGEGGSSESFKISFAYEQYESYIKALARATAEYRNMIKQYLELADEDDERRLKIEHMRVTIDKAKAEIDRLSNDDGGPIEIMIQRKG